MSLYGTLRDARGNRSPYIQHPLGSRGGIAGAAGLHAASALPDVRRAGIWVDQAAAAWRCKVGAPLFWWLRMGERAVAKRPLGSQEARRVGWRRGLSL
jgi:hypothetical protein